MNMRKELKSKFDNVSRLTSKRKESCELRHQTQLDVTTCNKDIINELVSILQPISDKTKISFKLEIHDHDSFIKTNIQKTNKTISLNPEISFPIGKFNTWSTKSNLIKEKVKNIEFILRSLKLYSMKNNLTLLGNRNVTVEFKTRDRYF